MKRRDGNDWVRTRNRDPYFIKARKEGYRARSAYKLMELHEKFKLIPHTGYILDLGAAPGAWLQVLKKNSQAKIEGIDLLDIQQINKVITLKADIFSQQAKDFLKDKKYDLILSDMAPNCTGQKELDHCLLINLLEQVLIFAKQNLKEQGKVCMKVFDGYLLQEFLIQFKESFHKIKRFKPKSSCADNNEFYLIGELKEKFKLQL